MATLSIIGTPIGNLEDITIRAISTLKTADLILCEDTRVTKKLLSAYGIVAPTLSYHAHSKLSRTDRILSMLREGKKLALVSDAGTPGISDPGAELVSRVRRELSDMVESKELVIEAIPGPSALTAALSVAGAACSRFTFLGFLPHKKGRETIFKEIASSDETHVFYESPHRILKTLSSLSDHCGDTKTVFVCRELTKVFEEVASGSPQDILSRFEEKPETVRGEFVVIVAPL